MSMRIITGSTGNNHVTSDDDRQFNAAIFGADSVVLPQGKRFEATLVDNNTINIADGEVVMQGCHARLNTGTTEDVVIETGAIGKQRIDLIVARYQLDTGTGFESVSLVVVKGVESTSNPAIPIINDNTSLRDGDTILDFALYKVMIDGINIDSVTPMFTPIDYVMGILDTNAEQIAAINSNLTQLEQKVESGLTYSTDEHIVGKWIDGRDVYEKTYSAKNIDIFNTTQIIDASFNSNNVELIGCEKVFIFSDGAQAVTSYNYSSGSSAIRVNANVTPNGIAIESLLVHIVGYNLTYKYVKK